MNHQLRSEIYFASKRLKRNSYPRDLELIQDAIRDSSIREAITVTRINIAMDGTKARVN